MSSGSQPSEKYFRKKALPEKPDIRSKHVPKYLSTSSLVGASEPLMYQTPIGKPDVEPAALALKSIVKEASQNLLPVIPHPLGENFEERLRVELDNARNEGEAEVQKAMAAISREQRETEAKIIKEDT
jgi:hypothetical protein